ncbi:MAG: glycoside hydrolase family 2 [Bacteroidales bacterium]|nr:glycoside hydrolase family 2 [Bacteroidales bacterium]
MNTRFLFTLFFFFAFAATSAQTEHSDSPSGPYARFYVPDAQYRPFVRWWWNGDKVERDELIRELHLLHDAGIGGVEINPIEFPSRCDSVGKPSLVWLSDEWLDVLESVLQEAKKLNMRCDLIVGSGWPFGAETLPPEDRASVMLTYALPTRGDTTLILSKSEIMAAVDPKVTVPNPLRTSELVSLLLVPDPVDGLYQVEDFTSQFDSDSLVLHVPSGPHVVYALVRYDAFASVINGAPGAAGSILDHLNADAVRRYLLSMSDALTGKLGALPMWLRALFADSMELEGCNWTGDFAAEFRRRRGYDLMPWLPFTMFKVGRLGNVESYKFGAEKTAKFQEQVNRVRYDFETTKAELLHERYTATFLQWCRDNGVKSRAQAYGRGFFPLESSLAYDIPEGESWTTNYLRHRVGEEMGDSDYRRGRAYTMINKYVSSAAHLSGNRIVSAEEMTNTYRVFNTSLELLKVGSDMSAFSGVTHSVWHGFNYSPPEAGFPGWVQYGSYYNEQNPWWPYFHLLNDYRARMSALLQNADMVADIAILPANEDLWTIYGVQTEPFPEKLNVPYTSLLWEAIHKNGGGADYVSDRLLQSAEVKEGKLCVGKKTYKVLILAEVSGISAGALATISDFVAAGGRVFCIGKFPDRSLGLLNFEKRDKQIQKCVKKLENQPQNFVLLEKPSDGKFLEWYGNVMRDYSLPHTITISSPDRFLLQNHYVMDDGSDFFLFVNGHLTESRATEVIFQKDFVDGRTAWLYDAATGERYRLPLRADTLSVTLCPAETWLVVFDRDTVGPCWQPLPEISSHARELTGWQVQLWNPLLADSESKSLTMRYPVDLRETADSTFSGVATYKTTVLLDSMSERVVLDLGRVADVCELFVNGRACGVKWFGRRVYDITPYIHLGSNSVEVRVTTLIGNYLRTFSDDATVQHYIFKRGQSTVPAGLIGPVMLDR